MTRRSPLPDGINGRRAADVLARGLGIEKSVEHRGLPTCERLVRRNRLNDMVECSVWISPNAVVERQRWRSQFRVARSLVLIWIVRRGYPFRSKWPTSCIGAAGVDVVRDVAVVIGPSTSRSSPSVKGLRFGILQRRGERNGPLRLLGPKTIFLIRNAGLDLFVKLE